jgi:hypothetical protein
MTCSPICTKIVEICIKYVYELCYSWTCNYAVRLHIGVELYNLDLVYKDNTWYPKRVDGNYRLHTRLFRGSVPMAGPDGGCQISVAFEI